MAAGSISTLQSLLPSPTPERLRSVDGRRLFVVVAGVAEAGFEARAALALRPLGDRVPRRRAGLLARATPRGTPSRRRAPADGAVPWPPADECPGRQVPTLDEETQERVPHH